MITDFPNGRWIEADCFDAMSEIPDGSVDMVLCDLPYGTTQNKWDSVLPLDDLWASYEWVCKDNAAIALTAQTPFDKVLGASNLPMLRYEWIWEKNKATGHLNAKRAPMKAHENVLIFYDKKPPYNPQMGEGVAYSNRHKPGDSGSNYGKVAYSEVNNRTTRYPRSVVEFSVDMRPFHPTQKPVALFKYLIRTYTNPGDTVLDNCAGSGTTAIAAENCGRKWICIERDPGYSAKALERIAKHIEGK